MTSHDDLVKQSLRLLSYYRHRIWWIVSRVFVLTIAITVVGMALTPKYVARTKMTLLPTRSEIGFAAIRPEVALLSSPAAMLVQTHVESLLSRTLAEDVARKLLAENAAELNNGGAVGHVRHAFLAPTLGGIHRLVTLLNTGRWETPDPFMSLVYAIQGNTDVQNAPGSFVFMVSVTWDNPKIAAKIANLLTELHVVSTLRSNQEEMRTTREFIAERIKETERDLEAIDKKTQDYRVGEKLFASSTVELGIQELSQYTRDLNATRVNWEQMDARIAALKPYETPAALAAIEADRSGLKSRQTAVEKVIDEQIAKLDKMPAKENGLLDLYRDRLIKERALGGLQDRLMETKVAEAAQLSSARVIDPAIPPVYPERPLLLRNAAASLFVGVLLSIGFVLMVEARRAGLRSRDDLGPAGAAMIGLVPYVAADGHGDPDSENAGKMAEFFRGVAHGRSGTVLHRRAVKRHLENLFVHLTDGDSPRIHIMVSLTGGEGKTFLIEQLARLAEDADRKVLLIDADLSAPFLHRRFDKPAAAGLAEMLMGKAVARDVAVPVNAHIDLIGAGLVRLSPQAKWAVQDVKKDIDSFAARYDLVLIDSAGLRYDPSATRLLPLARQILCVFDATKSRLSDLDNMRDRIGSTAGAVKFILNKVRHAPDYLFVAGPYGRAAQRPENGDPARDGSRKANRGHASDV